MDLDKERAKTKEVLDKYFDELAYSYASFELFFQLRYRNEEWQNVYKISPVFFNMIIKSLLSESVLTLCKFIEGYEIKGRSKLNLNMFLEKLKNEQDIFIDLSNEELEDLGNSFEKYTKELESYKSVIKNLLAWRDRFIAHFDVLKMSEITRKAKISAEEIREVISFIADMLNYYYYKIERGTIVSYKYLGYDDVQRLMAFAIQGINDNRKQALSLAKGGI